MATARPMARPRRSRAADERSAPQVQYLQSNRPLPPTPRRPPSGPPWTTVRSNLQAKRLVGALAVSVGSLTEGRSKMSSLPPNRRKREAHDELREKRDQTTREVCRPTSPSARPLRKQQAAVALLAFCQLFLFGARSEPTIWWENLIDVVDGLKTVSAGRYSCVPRLRFQPLSRSGLSEFSTGNLLRPQSPATRYQSRIPRTANHDDPKNPDLRSS